MLKEISLPKSWDHESDVLIIGAGNAGLPAAIEAARAGAKTTVIEQAKEGAISGSLPVFFGKHITFVNSDLQKKLGITDSLDTYYEDALRVTRGDPALWRTLVDNTPDSYPFFVGLGAEPVEIWRLPGHTVPRGHFIKGGGPEIKKILINGAKKAGAEILYGHKAAMLLVDPAKKRVVGVQVQKDGKTLNFKARKAVVITTGGFMNNAKMVEEFRGLSYAEICVPMSIGHDGSGIEMAMSIGAATKNIGTAAIASIPIDANTRKMASLLITHILCGGILVNQQGKRFINESIPKLGGRVKDPFIGEAGLRQPGTYIFVIYDQAIRDKISLVDWSIFKEYKADTIEDLASKIGSDVDPKGLIETVKRYNSDIEKFGYDTVFNKKIVEVPPNSPVIPIAKPPFYAIKGIPSLTSFKGGLKMNTKAQAVDLHGEVIPGLYAAGEVAGGLFSDGCYFDGTMLSMSLVFGRIAGKNAAAEKP